MSRPKTNCTFDALFRFKAGFLVTRQKLLHLLHYYMEMQVFGMMHQKGANLLHYYIENKIFS